MHDERVIRSLEFNLHLEFFKRGVTDEMRSPRILLLTLSRRIFRPCGALWLTLVKKVQAACSDCVFFSFDAETRKALRRFIITVGAKRFHCADVFFQPSFNGHFASGSTTSLPRVLKSNVDIRITLLYANVTLSYGATVCFFPFH